MNILFLTDNFPPEVNAPASRTYDHVRQWQKAGNQITVITCAPNFPQGKVYDGYKNQLYHVEYMEGIRVVRVWSYIAENKGFVKRTLDYISYSVSAFFAGLFQKTDIIIAYITPILHRPLWPYLIVLETQALDHGGQGPVAGIHQDGGRNERQRLHTLFRMGRDEMLPIGPKNRRGNRLLQKNVDLTRSPRE